MKFLHAICGLLLCSPMALLGQQLEKVYIQTDRDLYGTNDTLWFKGYVFDMENHISDKSISLNLLLIDEQGNKINDRKWPIFNGMASGSLVTPSFEGRYKLMAFSGQMAGNEELVFQKDIHIRSEIADQILLSVSDIKRGTINPTVVDVTLSAKRTQREAFANEKIGYELWSASGLKEKDVIKTNNRGMLRVHFQDLNLRDSVYEVIFEVVDKDIYKNIRLAVPLNFQETKVDLQFFPEGGNLIESLTNHVAFKAIDEEGQAIEVKGELLDSQQNKVLDIESYYAGMGDFFFTPKPGEQYFVRLNLPEGIEQTYPIPLAQSQGIALNLRKAQESTEAFLDIRTSNALIGEELLVNASTQSGTFEEQFFVVKARNFVRVPLASASTGIVKITITNQQGHVLAERLIFNKPENRIKIDIKTDRKTYHTREKTSLTLLVTDLNGQPMEGNFSLSVIDNTRNLSPNSNQPNLLAQILLNSELKGNIPTPNFYFSEDEKATPALDLVMLTNGWRKYATKTYDDPESVAGKLIQRNSRKKVIADTELNLVNMDGLDINPIAVDAEGQFHIPSTYLKNNGDSFLLTTKAQDRVLSANIDLSDSSKARTNEFRNQLASDFGNSVLKPNFSVFKPELKLEFDRFQDALILNTFTITERNFFGNACDALALDKEGNWVTKTREQLDLTHLDFVGLLQQVSDKVIGYGPISTRRVSYDPRLPFFRRNIPGFSAINGLLNDAIAVGAILSSYKERVSFRIADYRPLVLEWPVPFDVYLNCEYVEPNPNREQRFPYQYYTTEDFESIDLSNIESISVNAPSTAGKRPEYYVGLLGIEPRPIIVLKTIEGKLIRKPRLYPYFFFTAYDKESVEFYTPAYETQASIDSPIPDLRNTIHWQTDIFTNSDGKASITYYNADRLNKMLITVEGIDIYSRLGSQTASYQVDKVAGAN